MIYHILHQAHEKRGESNAKLEVMKITKFVSALKKLDWHGGTQTRTHVAVPQHGPLSLYTKHEGPSLANFDFYSLQYYLWMVFKGR